MNVFTLISKVMLELMNSLLGFRYILFEKEGNRDFYLGDGQVRWLDGRSHLSKNATENTTPFCICVLNTF